MEDFKLVLRFVLSLFNIELPILGYRISILSIMIGSFILFLVIRLVVGIFRGD